MPPTYRIVPLPFALVDRVRRTFRDDFGNPVRVVIDEGHGNPCRFTLRPSQPGDELLLLSYRPFSGEHPYAETGPIFIRRHGDIGYQTPHRFPPELDPTRRVFHAYNAAEETVDARLGTDNPEGLISEIFANPDVHCIHVRALTYGCYTFKIERA